MQVSFPQTDPFWRQARDFLAQPAQPTEATLAPNEFLEFFLGIFSGTYAYNVILEQFAADAIQN